MEEEYRGGGSCSKGKAYTCCRRLTHTSFMEDSVGESKHSSAVWAQQFADAYCELVQGEADEHYLLELAYELWPANGHRDAAEVASEEFIKLGAAPNRSAE